MWMFLLEPTENCIVIVLAPFCMMSLQEIGDVGFKKVNALKPFKY